MPTLIDYEKTNKYLPTSLREFIGATNRISTLDYRAFLPMYQGVEQLAVFNNQTAAEFASGFVSTLNYMYLRSGVAPKLLDIVVSKTVGRVGYQTNVSEEEVEAKMSKDYFSDCLYKGFNESASTGRSLMVLYQEEEEGKVNIESYNLFRHRCIYDKHKNVKEAWLYMVRAKGEQVGFENTICEHRFYKRTRLEDGTFSEIPYQEFLVYAVRYDKEDRTDAKYEKIETDKIDKNILRQYPDINFNVARELPFGNIGVFDIRYTAVNKKFIDSDIPEAMFVDAVDEALTVDTSITGKEVEKEIGRGQILIPEFGKGADFTSYQTQGAVGANVLRTIGHTYKNPIIMPYPSMKMEDSKPSNIQFDIRSEQWNAQIDNDVARLCESVGVGLIDYAPRLVGASQHATDDEINAMTDITANTVNNFRNLNQRKINEMLSTILFALGFEDTTASIRWSMAAILNPSKNTDLVIKKLQAGLISRKAAIQQANPDMSEAEVEQMLKEINGEMQQMQVATSFNNF